MWLSSLGPPDGFLPTAPNDEQKTERVDPGALGGVEHVLGADHVGLKAPLAISRAQRNKRRDVIHPVAAVERAAERGAVAQVALDPFEVEPVERELSRRGAPAPCPIASVEERPHQVGSDMTARAGDEGLHQLAATCPRGKGFPGAALAALDTTACAREPLASTCEPASAEPSAQVAALRTSGEL